jgi:hypothetical protein
VPSAAVLLCTWLISQLPLLLLLLLLLYPKNDARHCCCCCHRWGCVVKTAAAIASMHRAVAPANCNTLERLKQSRAEQSRYTAKCAHVAKHYIAIRK